MHAGDARSPWDALVLMSAVCHQKCMTLGSAFVHFIVLLIALRPAAEPLPADTCPADQQEVPAATIGASASTARQSAQHSSVRAMATANGAAAPGQGLQVATLGGGCFW
jgi:hypothetical protein